MGNNNNIKKSESAKRKERDNPNDKVNTNLDNGDKRLKASFSGCEQHNETRVESWMPASAITMRLLIRN